MGLALFKERRMTERKRLTGLFPGKLVRVKDQTDLGCKPTDISKHGLGILVDKELEPGEQLTLMIQDAPLILQVAWVQPDFGKSDLFRHGLVSIDPSRNLEDEFVAKGCLL